MIKNFSLYFRLKKPINYVKGNMPIYLRITVDSKRTELSINREFDPTRWNQRSGRATGTKEDAKTLNAYLDLMQVKVYEAYQSLVLANETVSPEKIKNKLQGKKENTTATLVEVFTAHNHQMIKLIERDEYAKGTLTHFTTTLMHTKAFLQSKYKAVDIQVDKINYSFISDFEYYLKTEVCAHNTAMKYLGDLKKIVLICVKRGWLPRDPFLGYKMSRREVEKDFLVEEELRAISNKLFASERLTLVKDIFLFSCYTGLAYADVKKLKRSEIRIGVDSKRWLFIKRQKSTTPAAIPLLPPALEILDKYSEHPRCMNTNLALPILCNQKMNEYLKEIADVCGISKTLTYHTARYTFATTITLNNDVPIESVSKMLGHKSLKQTQHYATILNKKISEDMIVLSAKLAQRANSL